MDEEVAPIAEPLSRDDWTFNNQHKKSNKKLTTIDLALKNPDGAVNLVMKENGVN